MQVLGYAARSVVGCVREHNEDALLCAPDLQLWAVADGMGGLEGGEVASALVVEHLRRVIGSGQSLPNAVQKAHRAIISAMQKADEKPMGSTVVATQFSGCNFVVVWVGDSRAYRISLRGIEQITRDHSWVQAMVDAGEISAEQARTHPRRNLVTQCLGQQEQPLQVSQVIGCLEPGELLLLCSDGLTGELSDDEIFQLCSSAATLDELVETLINQANLRGGKDNISCIVVGRQMDQQESSGARAQGFFSRWLFPRKANK